MTAEKEQEILAPYETLFENLKRCGEIGGKAISTIQLLALLLERQKEVRATYFKEAEHWKKMYECAQNANSFRQSVLSELEL